MEAKRRINNINYYYLLLIIIIPFILFFILLKMYLNYDIPNNIKSLRIDSQLHNHILKVDNGIKNNNIYYYFKQDTLIFIKNFKNEFKVAVYNNGLNIYDKQYIDFIKSIYYLKTHSFFLYKIMPNYNIFMYIPQKALSSSEFRYIILNIDNNQLNNNYILMDKSTDFLLYKNKDD